MFTPYPITNEQLGDIRALQHRLKLNDSAIDLQSKKMFAKSLDELTIRDASVLISELQSWKKIPSDLQRAMGQLDLL
jgi:hypothetical protein